MKRVKNELSKKSNLRKLRESMDLTQKEFAENWLNCSIETLKRYEKDPVQAKPELLIKFMNKFEKLTQIRLSLDYLYGLSDYKEVNSQAIHEQLGLSNKAIHELKKLGKNEVKLINQMEKYEALTMLLHAISVYEYNGNKKQVQQTFDEIINLMDNVYFFNEREKLQGKKIELLQKEIELLKKGTSPLPK